MEIVPVPTTIKPATVADVALISSLGQKIWWQHYPGIISDDQIRHMLGLMYSPQSLENQFLRRGHRFVLGLNAHAEAEGFCSYSIRMGGGATWVYLNKLYLLKEARGTGLGTAMLNHVINFTRDRGILQIKLNVNRLNPTVLFYQKRGFEVEREEVLHFSPLFVMDDFVMRLKVAP